MSNLLHPSASAESQDATELSKDLLREAFGMFPAGVTVLSASTPAGPYGTTVTAFASLSMEPPMVMVALAKTSNLLGHIHNSRLFGVNYLSADQHGIAANLASSRKDCTSVEWIDLEGVPTLTNCRVTMSVRADSIHDAGDHELIWGEIVGVAIGDRDLEPLIYHSRNFATLTHLTQPVT